MSKIGDSAPPEAPKGKPGGGRGGKAIPAHEARGRFTTKGGVREVKAGFGASYHGKREDNANEDKSSKKSFGERTVRKRNPKNTKPKFKRTKRQLDA